MLTEFHLECFCLCGVRERVLCVCDSLYLFCHPRFLFLSCLHVGLRWRWCQWLTVATSAVFSWTSFSFKLHCCLWCVVICATHALMRHSLLARRGNERLYTRFHPNGGLELLLRTSGSAGLDQPKNSMDVVFLFQWHRTLAKSKAVTQEAFSETLAKRIMGKLLSQEDQCTLMLISWVASVTSEKTHQQTWLGKFGRAAWRPSPDVDYSYKDTSMHHWAWLWHHGIIVTSAVCMQRSYWPGQGGMAAF